MKSEFGISLTHITATESSKQGIPIRDEPVGRIHAAWHRLRTWFGASIHSDRRCAKRQPGNGLVAFYWEGDSGHPHHIRDISDQGAFVEASFLWTHGTLLNLILQIRTLDPPVSIAVMAKVVRTSPDGMGVQFDLYDGEPRNLHKFLSTWETLKNSSDLMTGKS